MATRPDPWRKRSPGPGLALIALLLAGIGTGTGLARAEGAEAAGFDAAHRVTFRSGATPVDKFNFDAPHDVIEGYLYRPEGDGPFPAVVLVPDIPGLIPVQKAWALRLAQWGYVALAVDNHSHAPNHTPREISNAHDAYGALRYLSGLPFVAARDVAWIGWGSGGGRAIVGAGLRSDASHSAVPMRWLVSLGPWRFRAGIAFYPSCPGAGQSYYAPLLMLLPGRNARFLDSCRATAERSTAGGERVRITVYPNATHSFDIEGIQRDLYSDIARYEPAATADAIVRVKAFLAAHLGKEDGR